MAAIEIKKFETPDETRAFGHGKLEIVKVGGAIIGRARFEPGWRWSKDVQSIAKTKSCQASHLGFQVSGKMGVRMDDGTERELHAGEVSIIPPGHDAWVVGNEPVVVIDFQGMVDYAKGAAKK